MDKLKTWLSDRELTQEAGAVVLGVPARRLRSWIYDGKRPRSVDEMQRIETVTRGAVRVSDWLRASL